MDARAIDNLDIADPCAETRNMLPRWRDIVKLGIYRQSGGRWKGYHEPRLLRNEKRTIEEQLQLAIQNIENGQVKQPQGFQPQERRNEQWTVDPFWEVHRQQRQQPQQEDESGPSSKQSQYTPMEEGEIGSETDRDPSVLEVPATNWAK